MQSFSAAMLALFLSACDMQRAEYTPMTTATFGLQMVESGTMTRATSEEIITMLEGKLPTSVELTLAGDEDSYNVIVGKPTSIPLGSYNVTGKYHDTRRVAVIGSSVYLSPTPSVIVSDDVTISYDMTTYNVAAEYVCYALVVDLTETASVSYQSSTAKEGEVSLVQSGTTGFIFVCGKATGGYLNVTLQPYEGSGRKATTYTIKTDYDATAVYAEYGKYYVLRPYEITEVEAGYINWQLSSWTEGTVPTE